MRNILLIPLLCWLFGYAQIAGNPEQPSVYQERSGDTFEVFVRNPLYAPISIQFNITSSKMELSKGGSFEAIIPAHSITSVFTAAPTNPRAEWSFDYKNRWVLGDINAKHDNTVVYDLPFAKGKRYSVVQGFGGKFSHTEEFYHSVDFDMEVGTPVHAAREGVVVQVETSYSRGAPDPALMEKANFITVLHSDHTLGHYGHLRAGGSVVKVGQKVGRGDHIGYSGNTGFSDGPHLHFHVEKPLDTGDKWTTLKIRFRAKEGEGIELKEGQSYARP